MIELESRLTNSEISPFSLEARDEDYDTYLFWPSLNSGTATFEKPFVATHQRVRRLFSSCCTVFTGGTRLAFIPPVRPCR